MHRSPFLVVLFAVALCPPVSKARAGQGDDYSRYDGLVVRNLDFVGMSRTSPARLVDHFDTKPGQKFDSVRFKEDMRKLRNLELFQAIRVEILVRPKGLFITIHLKDKWSLLPYFNFIRGGGSYEIVTGIYDVNVLGRLFLLDAMFILFDGKPAGLLYFTFPRLAGLPITLAAQGGVSRAIRTTYGSMGAVRRIYAVTSQWGELQTRWEPVVWARVGLAYRFQHRTFSFTTLSPNQDVLPPEGRISKASVLFSLGKVSYEHYFMNGLLLNVWFSTSQPWLGATHKFYKISWDARGYWNMGRNIGNLAGWLQGGIIRGQTTFLDEFQLGSFSGMRGFRYAQFLGRAYVAAVAEYRSPLWATEFPIMAKVHKIFGGKSLLVQAVAFGSMGAVAHSRNQATSESGKLLSSVGGGARFIVVPFYRAVLRIDGAITMNPYRTWDIMVATQQAF